MCLEVLQADSAKAYGVYYHVHGMRYTFYEEHGEHELAIDGDEAAILVHAHGMFDWETYEDGVAEEAHEEDISVWDSRWGRR